MVSTYEVGNRVILSVVVSPMGYENGSLVRFEMRDWSINDLSQYNKISMTREDFEFLFSRVGEHGGTSHTIKTKRISDCKISIEMVDRHDDTGCQPKQSIVLSLNNYIASKKMGLKLLYDLDIMLPFLCCNSVDRPVIQDKDVLSRILLAVCHCYYDKGIHRLDESGLTQEETETARRAQALDYLNRMGLIALNWALKSRNYKPSRHSSISDIIPDLNQASKIVTDPYAHDPIAQWFATDWRDDALSCTCTFKCDKSV